MKASVAITLIISGVVVTAIPALWGGWNSLMLSVTLTHLPPTVNNVQFEVIPPPYQFGCWVLGAAMIFVAVIASLRSGTADTRSPRLAGQVG